MITVIFSSHNGGSDVCRTLDSMTRLEAPAGGWRLIAVDNASTDGTGAVLRSYADRLPITVLHEPARGKNRALNRALDQADGDFFVFTDDDVIFAPNWLTAWREVADAQPSYDLFAGLTVARWHSPPADWVLRAVDASVVFAMHVDMEEGPCTAGNMYGPNMAIRGTVIANGGRFCVDIGPDGTPDYAMGSDTEIALRLEAQGLKCWFAKSPCVEHIVPPEHLELPWIIRRGYRWGRGLARMSLPFHCEYEVLVRKNNLKTLLYPMLLPLVSPRQRLRRQWQFMVDRGYEDGMREMLGREPRWP
jgi:glucosyl-dolichyl phosphate glucuronosyltransferase